MQLLMTFLAILALSIVAGHLLGWIAARIVTRTLGLDPKPERDSKAQW